MSTSWGKTEYIRCHVELGKYPNDPRGKGQRAQIQGTESITLGDYSTNEEIERQWTRIKTSLAILRNLHIERANMEFWTRFEIVTKGMR